MISIHKDPKKKKHGMEWYNGTIQKLSRQETPNSVKIKTKCNVCVTTLCEHSICDHSMLTLYMSTLCVTTLCEHSIWEHAKCEHSMCDHSM